MAGRHRLPSNSSELREASLSRSNHHLIDHRRLLKHHHETAAEIQPNRAHSSVVLEDRIDLQHREIQALLLDNQRLAATHAALKQERALAEEDIRHLSAAVISTKAERDAQVREVYQRSLKMEAEARSVEAMRAELNEVRADIQKLIAFRKESTARLQVINNDLAIVQEESKEVLTLKGDIEKIGQEIHRGRAAIEKEKKTRASNFEHRQAMENCMVSLTSEIEKLRAELANAEKRARSAAVVANPGDVYAPAIYAAPDMVGYGASPYPGSYGPNQVQAGTVVIPPYMSEAIPHGTYGGMSEVHAPR